MKVRTRRGDEVRRILIAMVTDVVALGRISARWTDDGFFDSPWSNLIAGWCVQFFKNHGTAPGREIESMFAQYAARSSNEEVVDHIERFMADLSDQYEREDPPSSQYVVDLAGRYFNKIRLRRMLRVAEEELDRNQVEAAETVIAETRKIQLGLRSYTEPDSDWDLWQRALSPERDRPLLSYPGDLGKMVNDSLVRDSLIAIMAPDKVGKSIWLVDMAVRALADRRRVAYFDAGDMTDEQVLQRFGVRASGRPLWDRKVRIPTAIDEEHNPVFAEKKVERLTDIVGMRALQRLSRASIGDDSRFRLSCWANDTLRVDDVLGLCTEWAEDGWVADVIVIDYADILAPPDGVRDPLDQIDVNWKRLRRLSQEVHALVLTATQSNAAAYKDGEKKGVLTRKNFSGRKTKLAHVNGMLALNQTPDEKQKGIQRVNWVVRRNAYFHERVAVTCAGQFKLGRPAMQSRR